MIDKFIYLGSTLSRVEYIDDHAMIAKASGAFGRLRVSIWDQSGIRLKTKLNVYKSVKLPILLDAYETPKVYQRYVKILNHFHTSCLRKLLKIKWQERIPDTEVLKRAGMQSVLTILKLAQFIRTSHFTRMPAWWMFAKENSLWRTKWENAPRVVRRSDAKSPSKPTLMNPTYLQSSEQIAQDRAKWRGLIRRGADEYEMKRISKPEQKRVQRKARSKASPTELSSSDLSCSTCNRQLNVKIEPTAILEHKNSNTSHIWLGLAIVSNYYHGSLSLCTCHYHYAWVIVIHICMGHYEHANANIIYNILKLPHVVLVTGHVATENVYHQDTCVMVMMTVGITVMKRVVLTDISNQVSIYCNIHRLNTMIVNNWHLIFGSLHHICDSTAKFLFKVLA